MGANEPWLATLPPPSLSTEAATVDNGEGEAAWAAAGVGILLGCLLARANAIAAIRLISSRALI